MNFFSGLTTNKKKLFGILGFLILAASVPAALILTKTQQEIRQRASGTQTTIYFANQGSTAPLSSLTVNPGAAVSLDLYLNAKTIPLSGFDITVSGGSLLTINKISPVADSSKFDTRVFLRTIAKNNSARFSKVNSIPATSITGLLHIATISFTASSSQGSDTLTIPSVLITSPIHQTGLTVALPNLSYTVSSGQTITPSSTLTPTTSPSVTPTGNVSPTSTPTTTASVTPSATPTSIPPGSTALSLTIGLHGIGNGGTNLNPNSKGTVSPIHTTRTVTLVMFNLQNNQLPPIQGKVNFDNSMGLFTGTVSAQNVPTGDYQLKVQTDGFLVKQLPSILHVVSGQTNVVPPLMLVNGDINNDNQVDILDYGLLINCFEDKVNSSSCQYPPTQQSAGADIDDSGIIDNTTGAVNGFDYNLFIWELSTQKGQ